MPDIALRFATDVVVVDGGLGSLLLAEGIESDMHPMFLNVLEPDMIQAIHKRYIQAGAQAITSNSFGGSRPQLATHGLADRVEEFNRMAVRLAKACQPEHVLADVGPCGLMMPPFGIASFDEVFQIYVEQITALAAEEPDAILIETMIDIADARCAVLAAKTVSNLPVFASVSFAASGRMELSGTDVATAAVILEAAGADVIGMNCGLGHQAFLPLLSEMAAYTTLPLLVQPNAGLPQIALDGSTSYLGTPEEMAEAAWAYRQLGAQFIGSCCGSTPSHTAAIYVAVGGSDAVKVARGLTRQQAMVLASPASQVRLAADGDCQIISGCLKPNSPELQTSDLSVSEFSTITSLLIDQVESGAKLINVNLDAWGVDTASVLPALVSELSSLVKAPLMISADNSQALEAALRVYPGRAIISLVNHQSNQLQQIMPSAKRYGAAVVISCSDQASMNINPQLAHLETILSAAHQAGLSDNDILFDVTNQISLADPRTFEQAVSCIRELVTHGLLSMLDMSDFRPQAELLKAAVEAGLNAVVLDPQDEILMSALAKANQARQKQFLLEKTGAISTIV
ncbi:MAG: homocysteine S-methyltransferase family protein [Coriobacteriales bacterium]|nr:homocysteine S-methyltransferase family protein [Coriobacteriales bacterium]